MPYNGSGIFTKIYSWISDATNGIPISSSRMDSQDNDFASGLSNCITRDGQGGPSAAISWNGQNLTNVAIFGATGNATIGGTLNVTGILSVPTLAVNQSSVLAGYNLDVNGKAKATAFDAYNYGSAPLLEGFKANGTSSAPTAITASGNLLRLFGYGYDGANYQLAAEIDIVNDGAITSTSAPAAISLRTTPSGSVSPVERLNIASTGLVTAQNGLTVNGTTTTGAISASGNVTSSTTLASPIIYAQGSASTGGTIYLNNTNSSGTYGQLLVDASGNVRVGSIVGVPLQFYTASTFAGAFTAAGQFVVGATSSSGGLIEARKDQNATTAFRVINGTVGVSAIAQCQMQTGTAQSLWTMTLADNNGSPFRVSASGSAVTQAYDDCDTHNFRTAGGTTKLISSSGGNLTLAINNSQLQFTDASGTHPYIIVQNDNNFVFYGTDSAGAARSIWSCTMRNSSSTFNVTPDIVGSASVRAASYLKSGTYTVATLPSAAAAGAGARAAVTDATAASFGAVTVGGGAVTVPVFVNSVPTWITG